MEKAEDSLALRRNPLNIRASDGSDIVVGKAPRQAKAHIQETVPDRAFAATADYADSGSESDDSVPTGELDSISSMIKTKAQNMKEIGPNSQLDSAVGGALNGGLDDQLTQLSIGALPQDELVKEIRPLSPSRLKLRASESMDLSTVDLDFGTDITADLNTLLSRKNTIALRSRPPPTKGGAANIAVPKARSGPSRDKQLIQRLRSIRKRLSSDSLPEVPDADVDDDAKRAQGLPNGVLQMIAFSPDSPWLGSEMEAASETESDSESERASGEKSDGRMKESGDNLGLGLGVELGVKDIASTMSTEKLGPAAPLPDMDSPETHLTFSNSNPFRQNELSPASLGSGSSTPGAIATDSESRSASVAPSSPVADVTAKAKARPAGASPLIEEVDPVRPEDRGRLFLQVNKLANVRGLPIDPARHPRFTLVLDNGIQTVTTEPTPLPAPGFNGVVMVKVGQEFELIVAQDLELVVTVNVQMDALEAPPRPTAPRIGRHAPTDSIASMAASSGSGASSSPPTAGMSSPVKGMRNLLRSPKKKQNEKFRRQQEERQREERQHQAQLERQQQQEDEQTRRYERDLAEFQRRANAWRSITGPHGEYCRGYLFESHYEKDIYGAAKSFALPLYNEWDKSAANGVPKPVCDLQVTMMYVPKLFARERIPMSMKECQHELREAYARRSVALDGFLTQQGGDCANTWRRRWFTLAGAEMVGHHEATRKRRALIHLENAVSVRDTLSEDLWCIYEDRSFEIGFDDGEALSFYADSIEERDRWVAALRSSLANCTGRHRAWTDLVIERHAV